MKRNKGFTLIELLVVIAIIGILSAIVLASLNSARTKANDAKTQGQISSIRAAAEMQYNTTTGYGVDCTALTTSLGTLMASSTYSDGTAPSLTCVAANGATSAWAASHTVAGTSQYACADSTGFSGVGAKKSTTGLCQ